MIFTGRENVFLKFVFFFLILFILPAVAKSELQCGDVVTENLTMTSDLNCTNYDGVPLTVGADNLTIDGAGFKLKGTAKGSLSFDINAGIQIINRNNVTIKNIIFESASNPSSSKYRNLLFISNGNGHSLSSLVFNLKKADVSNYNEAIKIENVFSSIFEEIIFNGVYQRPEFSGSSSAIRCRDSFGGNRPCSKNIFSNLVLNSFDQSVTIASSDNNLFDNISLNGFRTGIFYSGNQNVFTNSIFDSQGAGTGPGLFSLQINGENNLVEKSIFKNFAGTNSKSVYLRGPEASGGRTNVIRESSFYNNTLGLYLHNGTGECLLFEGNDVAAVFPFVGSGSSNQASISDSNFIGNTLALDLGFLALGTAINNYWGASGGPAPAGTGDKISGGVEYTPFLLFPSDCAPVVKPIKTPPVAEAGADQTGDQILPIQFNGSGSSDIDGQIVNYSWDFGDGSVAGSGANPTHIYTDTGIFTVRLTITDNDGLSSTDTMKVTIENTPPVASAGEDREGSRVKAISFSGSNSIDVDGNIVSYSWDFGDGNTAEGENVEHTYTVLGTFLSKLTVTDDRGAFSSDTISVSITNLAPIADAGDDLFGNRIESIQFDGSKSIDRDGSIAAYLWDFGDGSRSTEASPEHQYSEVGTFIATIEVTDSEGAKSTDSKTITIENIAPIPDAGDNKISNRLSGVQFDGSLSVDPDGTIVNYVWDFGDGTSPVESTATTSHLYKSIGQFSASLTVTDNEGKSSTTNIIVNVENILPIANGGSSQMKVSRFDFKVDASGSYDPDGSIVSYSWNFGDGTPIVNTSLASHTYSAPGSYSATLTVVDNDGGINSSNVILEVLSTDESREGLIKIVRDWYDEGLIPLKDFIRDRDIIITIFNDYGDYIDLVTKFKLCGFSCGDSGGGKNGGGFDLGGKIKSLGDKIGRDINKLFDGWKKKAKQIKGYVSVDTMRRGLRIVVSVADGISSGDPRAIVSAYTDIVHLSADLGLIPEDLEKVLIEPVEKVYDAIGSELGEISMRLTDIVSYEENLKRLAERGVIPQEIADVYIESIEKIKSLEEDLLGGFGLVEQLIQKLKEKLLSAGLPQNSVNALISKAERALSQIQSGDIYGAYFTIESIEFHLEKEQLLGSEIEEAIQLIKDIKTYLAAIS